ncbi:hypothetical protein RhiirA5_436888 [Rhizophagus irregularis]|uniref:Uncharacterized protein n=1 Tax=Rhizophagus irregularis TaxID=588596 RepID=A0A2I1F1N2_9GLOM|nr:hypothetical protein RhiirA5_436888 [Rhizophagus irregularis]PKY28289.1 hypothetical protein RhiirB3_529763 [Rhizophagus irregularis]
MESKLELSEQHISELEAENTELNDENTKLRQIIEENAMRDARVEELEQKNTELEARLALLGVIEDGVYEKKVSDEIKQHNKEKKLICEMANQEAPQ